MILWIVLGWIACGIASYIFTRVEYAIIGTPWIHRYSVHYGLMALLGPASLISYILVAIYLFFIWLLNADTDDPNSWWNRKAKF